VTFTVKRTGFFSKPDKFLQTEIMGEADEPDESS
jgi:hypothetical protein